jgi:pectate lyase
MKALILVFAMVCGAAMAADRFDASKLVKQPDAWFRSAAGSNIVANVLSHQATNGAWPKNLDTAEKPSDISADKIAGTFDNGATCGEIRFMARAFAATGDARCREAVARGIAHILKAQYPNGGWPQFFPPPATKYNRHITFNDGSMVNLLELLREVATSEKFAFLDASARESTQKAFDRGVACILKCQIKVGDKLTVWCAQHDEVTLEPRPARSYELASFSGGESAGILMFLMSLEKPSPEIVRAVMAGAAWYEVSKITGIKLVSAGGDKKIVKDPSAPPLWARFYEIETARPFFCDRDGVKKYDIAEIGHERRNGYAWYGNWGEKVAARFAEWKKQNPSGS